MGRAAPGSSGPAGATEGCSSAGGFALQFLATAGKALYRGWMRFVHLLGTVNRFVVMTLFYWVIIDVANLCLRLLRIDLLDRRVRPQPTYWHPKPPSSGSYTNQF